MKTICIMSMLLLATACSTTEEPLNPVSFDPDSLPQTWELYRMSGNTQGSVTEGEQMQWQETYAFLADGTFVKTRLREGVTLNATGTFTFVNEDGQSGIRLTYPEDSPLIGNCTGDFTEYLYVDQDPTTLLGSWWACDGPGLYYQQVD
ncbi:hypothetical protein OZ410_06370 [Robiginitalea sp. M366]|uniref:hypothetical protein n=1 Tax=Robiginitalea aestuariiviva TaxID=3036903 RepID=UPI00240E1DDD|nr:hypothetical protein [Robiginitalea aestuariiviva]MDG1571934.1 hypothetical protein [Robiginitalea aestuariiviva]